VETVAALVGRLWVMIIRGFRFIALFVAALGSAALPASAQQTAGATVTGTVRDSAHRPVVDADVIARPGGKRTRSDSAGRFVLTGLDAGKYTIVGRKLGFTPANWDVSLSSSGKIEIQLVLEHRMPTLDTVVVRADRTCAEHTLEGFACRKHSGGGVFLDYTDIDDKEPIWTADIFRDIKGFRVDVRSTRYGLVRIPVTTFPSGCITSLVDGYPASPARPVPESPYDLIAVEAYARADSVPREYQRYTWPSRGDVTRSGRCSVIAYWTLRARVK
jgi:hypothetical protein